MNKVTDLFTGIGGLRIMFYDAYAICIDDSTLNRLLAKCFDETPAYSLNSSVHPSQEEYRSARHLADLDIIEQFCSIYVRNHRNYKYCPGKADTANHVIQRLSEYGIFISVGKYNNWRREKNYRLIDDESLDLLLELLKVTPSEFKRLVYAHVLACREIKESGSDSGIELIVPIPVYLKDSRLLRIKLSRPPCWRSA